MNKLKQSIKNSIIPQIIISTLIAAAITAGIVSAATTIGTNISTGGNLAVTGTSTFTGLTTFGNASTTQISASSNIYTALTANSIPYIGSSGLLTQDNSNLVWDSTNNRMGIGTSSPYAKLSVVGEAVASNFTATSTTATTTLAGGLNVGSGGLIYDRSTGNVGIGTAVPSYALDVVGTVYGYKDTDISGYYAVYGSGVGGAGNGVYGYSNNQVGITGVTGASGGSAIYGVTALGKAGYFRQSGKIYSSYSTPVLYAYRNSDLNSYDMTGAILKVEDNTASTGNLLEIIKQSATKMVVNNAGNVGIGTTTPAQLLQVFNNTAATTTVEFGDISSSTAKTCFNVNTTDGSAGSFYFDSTSGIVFEPNACK